MNRLNRFADIANRRSWRLVWIVVSLGLVALSAGAPGGWEIP